MYRSTFRPPLQDALASTMRAWGMPILAGITAAVGGYLGVVRAIDDLQLEVRIMQAEHQASKTAFERRLTALEEAFPRDAVLRRDLFELEDRVHRSNEHAIERHEEAYHERSAR